MGGTLTLTATAGTQANSTDAAGGAARGAIEDGDMGDAGLVAGASGGGGGGGGGGPPRAGGANRAGVKTGGRS